MALFDFFLRRKKRAFEQTNSPSSLFGETYFWVNQDDSQSAFQKYLEVDDFFGDHIGDPTRNLLTSKIGRAPGENLVLLAVLNKKIIGAIWAGVPHKEAEEAVALGMLQGREKSMRALSEAMVQKSFMLHNMAVDEAYRRKGLGRLLLDKVLQEAQNQGKDLLWGVASPEAVDFYRNSPLEVAAEPSILALTSGVRNAFGLPLVGDSRWVFCHLRPSTSISARFVSMR
ncbi:GNAT family N-acetyltransferase [Glutamicibacter arilaitensis]|uniref:GNAT family N-acetyltransferase n=1 Tax=Glutamicibacter arilaitensis TaxID=256701 RepID=UPI003FD61E0B